MTLISLLCICVQAQAQSTTAQPIGNVSMQTLEFMKDYYTNLPAMQFEYTYKKASDDFRVRFTQSNGRFMFEMLSGNGSAYEASKNMLLSYDGLRYYFIDNEGSLVVASDPAQLEHMFQFFFKRNPVFNPAGFFTRSQLFGLPYLTLGKTWSDASARMVTNAQSPTNSTIVPLYQIKEINGMYYNILTTVPGTELPMHISVQLGIVEEDWNISAFKTFTSNGHSFVLPTRISDVFMQNGSRDDPTSYDITVDEKSIKIPAAKMDNSYFAPPMAMAVRIYDADIKAYIKGSDLEN